MAGPDLRVTPPPRWSAATGGVIWLTRFAAKVRAHDAGTLGTYLLGQSPIDDEFLAAAQLDYPSFMAIVRDATDDASVLAAIEARAPGATGRLQLWSTEMPVRRRLHIHMLDLDDGYERSQWFTLLRGAAAAIFVPLVHLLRALRPLKS